MDVVFEARLRAIIREEIDEHEALRGTRDPDSYRRLRTAVAADRATIEAQREGRWISISNRDDDAVAA